MARRNPATPQDLTQLKADNQRREHELEDAKLAYYNSAEYQGASMSYERLKAYAEMFIQANHALQKALYGRIQVRLEVSRLLRE